MFPTNARARRRPAVPLILSCVCLTVGPHATAIATESAISAACRPLVPEPGVTRGRIAGKNITFRAEASEQIVQGVEDCSWATMSSVAYLAEPPESSRPVTFLFNGGPGAATVALREGL